MEFFKNKKALFSSKYFLSASYQQFTKTLPLQLITDWLLHEKKTKIATLILQSLCGFFTFFQGNALFYHRLQTASTHVAQRLLT